MLPEITAEAARRFGDTVGYITEPGWTLSYADVDRISDELAVGLAHAGLREGDVLSLILPPGPEYLVSYLAGAKVGAITSGVNDRLATVERDAVLEIASPALVLAAPGFEPSGREVVTVEPAASADAMLADLRVRDESPPALAPDEDRSVAIVFTSGTTGIPKGALYGNRQLRFITETDTGMQWGGGGRGLNGTSYAVLGFMSKLPGNLVRGGTSLMMTRWRAENALRIIAEEKMTSIGGVPSQLALMLRRPEFDSYDLSAVQYIVAGGGPITSGLAEEVRARFGAKLATRYSCTEAGIGLGTGFDDPDEDAVVSVGRPLRGVEMVLLDEDDQPIPEGEVGRVCLRSAAAMSRYWHNPEGTVEAFTADRFVRTGDLGWVDDRGRLRLVGRSKEMYVRGGYNVYPVEVESVLSTHPDVAHVAVVPRPDQVMGEIGVAVVVVRKGAQPPTLASLRDHALGRLAPYKMPEAIEISEALPLTAAEKVDRRALAALVGSPSPSVPSPVVGP